MLQFAEQNGKLLIRYQYRSESGSAPIEFMLHDGNRKGTIFKESIRDRPFNITVIPYIASQVAFLEETYFGPSSSLSARTFIKSIRPIQNNVPMLPIYQVRWSQYPVVEPQPTYLFRSVGIIKDKFHVLIGDTLANFTTTGVRTNLKTGMDTILHIATVGNVMYFANRRNELWKTDGSIAGTVKLNPNFEGANELIINLLGDGTSPYVLTKAGNITHTYYITPQGTLSRVNLDQYVTYAQPFVSKGVQYIFAHRQQPNTACPISYLVRYGQTEAQTQSFELRDKNSAACASNLPSPISSVLTDKDVLYYGLNTNALGNELWKLDLKSTVPPTDYCASKGNRPWNEWISKVQFSNLNHASVKNGYGNFTGLTAIVVPGASYPFTLTQGYSWATDPTNASLQWRVWIDYNQNNVFEANELAASGTRTMASATIVIPATAHLGKTRMRVSLKKIGAPTACEVFENGEVEDYTVNITNVLPVSPRLSIENQPVTLELKTLSPNPTDGALLVTLKSLVAKEVTFDFYNTVGSKVYSQTQQVQNGENELFFDVTKLPTGVYFIQTSEQGGKDAPSKFVKY
jgi:hypothetical protein